MTTKGLVLILLAVIIAVKGSPHSKTRWRESPTCGYDACPSLDPNKFHIHLIAHTHDDVGWLKTVQQYYYGLMVPGISDQRAGVQYILDTVVRQLNEDPRRRFIYVETAFFWIWWKRQNPQMQSLVKELVDSGRLEFISGGWSMNDEASVHYNSVVDQMTWGHRRLADTFGKCAVPKIGWQIDPFGHSMEYASLISQMNFDGLFFARLDYDDKALRAKEKRMEFIWKSNQDLGKPSHILTGILPLGYGPPPNFCFDDTCGDPPIVDDPESEEYNVDSRVNSFLRQIEVFSKIYSTNHFITTFGSDFQYQNALIDFKNIDLLMKYVNDRQKSGSKYNLIYSTPTCYLKALHDSNKTWTTKSDDFFPYASDPHAFWTGYFTSRPAMKLFERKSNQFLQFCKQGQALTRMTDQETDRQVNVLREAMGIAQHHDAVSGTEKQHVARDYARQLAKGIFQCEQVMKKAYDKFAIKPNPGYPQATFCHSLNVSQCEFTEMQDKIVITIDNARSQEVTAQIAIPWSSEAYVVKDVHGSRLASDLVPISSGVQKLPERKANTTHEIVFTATIPPIGIHTVFLERKPKIGSTSLKALPVPDEGVELFGKNFSALFDKNGIVGVKVGNRVVKLKQQFLYYRGMDGDNTKWENRASGAYVFRPNGSANPFPKSDRGKAVFLNGSVMSEFRQKVNNWIYEVIRISTDSKFIEFDWVVGPIPIDDKEGKEVISRFETDVKNGNVFYTDANGRQLVKRVKDHRDTWEYNATNEPVSGNYYPVNSRILIRDDKADLQVTVLTDRSQGGTSLSEGTIELMVHRRLLHDDAFGVGEALNETGVDGNGLIIRGKHKVFVGSIKESVIHRDQAMTEYLPPLVSFRPYTTIEDYTSRFLTSLEAVKADFPKNVHILTLESWLDGRVLVRLEHFYQSSDGTDLAKPVTIDLKNMISFADEMIVDSVEEVTLTANQRLSEVKKFEWKTSEGTSGGNYQPSLNPKDLTVTLNPMDIRTFILTLKNSHEMNTIP